ncbi:MAG: hypothetical protein K7J46_18850 [Bryobacter sp.]|jgi:hypothetical protein|nr:hypothetical protein [Bryobacter sp. CoA8 C33]
MFGDPHSSKHDFFGQVQLHRELADLGQVELLALCRTLVWGFRSRAKKVCQVVQDLILPVAHKVWMYTVHQAQFPYRFAAFDGG